MGQEYVVMMDGEQGWHYVFFSCLFPGRYTEKKGFPLIDSAGNEQPKIEINKEGITLIDSLGKRKRIPKIEVPKFIKEAKKDLITGLIQISPNDTERAMIEVMLMDLKYNDVIQQIINSGLMTVKENPFNDKKSEPIKVLCKKLATKIQKDNDKKSKETLNLYLEYLRGTGQINRIEEMTLDGTITLKQASTAYPPKTNPDKDCKFDELLRKCVSKYHEGKLGFETFLSIHDNLQLETLIEECLAKDILSLFRNEAVYEKIKKDQEKQGNDQEEPRIIDVIKAKFRDAIIDAKKEENEEEQKALAGISLELYKRGIYDIRNLSKDFTQEALGKAITGAKDLKGLSNKDMLLVIAQIDSINEKDFRKMIYDRERGKNTDVDKKLTSNDVLETINAGDIGKNEVIKLLKKIPNNIRPFSDELFEFFEYFESFEKSNLPEENRAITFSGCDILELVKAGLIEDKRLVDVYEKYSAIKSIAIFPQAREGEIIPDEDYLQYFTLDRILPLLDNQEYVEKFKNMYFELQERQKKGQPEREEELINSYMANNKLTTKDKEENLIKLFQNGIIGLDSILKHISADGLTDLYYGDKITLDEIAKGFVTGNITKEKFYEIVENNSTIQKYIKDGDIETPTVVTAYLNGIIGVSDVGEIFSEDELLKKFMTCFTELEMPEDVEQRKQYSKKIKELVVNDLINYDILEDMQAQGIIGEDERKEMLSAYDFKKKIDEIKAKYSIKNTATPDGTGTIETGGLESRSKKGATTERTSEYMDFINSIGENKVTVIPIITGALEGYNFILLENMKVVVLEKGKNGNATYILPLKKATELAESKNKTDLRKEKNVKVVNHTANWGANLIGKISSIQKETLLPNRDDVTYVKDLLEGDKIKGLIEDIKTTYEETRKENEGGEYGSK